MRLATACVSYCCLCHRLASCCNPRPSSRSVAEGRCTVNCLFIFWSALVHLHAFRDVTDDWRCPNMRPDEGNGDDGWLTRKRPFFPGAHSHLMLSRTPCELHSEKCTAGDPILSSEIVASAAAFSGKSCLELWQFSVPTAAVVKGCDLVNVGMLLCFVTPALPSLKAIARAPLSTCTTSIVRQFVVSMTDSQKLGEASGQASDQKQSDGSVDVKRHVTPQAAAKRRERPPLRYTEDFKTPSSISLDVIGVVRSPYKVC